MNRISSQSTFFNKRVFPAIWFGFLGFFGSAVVVVAIVQQQFALMVPFIGGPLIMAIFGYVLMKWLLFDLVDEVWDCGDSLLVKNNGREYGFDLSDFMNVAYTGFVNPPRITLSLREASEIGTEVAFIPPFRLFPYSMHPIARDLIARIDDARRLT